MSHGASSGRKPFGVFTSQPPPPPLRQGLFVQLVKAHSPAALVGLRFGDQVLQIDGKDCAGWNAEKAKRVLKKASPEKIVMVVRDR